MIRGTSIAAGLVGLAMPMALVAQEAPVFDPVEGLTLVIPHEARTNGEGPVYLSIGGARLVCDAKAGADSIRVFDCATDIELDLTDETSPEGTDAPQMTLDQAIQLLELMPPPAFDAAFAAFLRDNNCVIDFSDEDYADNLMLYTMLAKLGIPARFGPELRSRVLDRAGDAVERLPGAAIDDVSLTVTFEGVCD